MAIKYNLQIIKNNVTTDISDYVFRCDDIPIYFERNNSWEPIISTFKISLSQAAPIVPAKNDVITFYINGQLKFTGFIESFTTDYENRAFLCDIASKLRYLQNNRLERSYATTNLYTVISDTVNVNEYNPNDTWEFYFDNHWVQKTGLRNVQMLWLLKSMFEFCGMTLDSTEVDDVLVAQTVTGTRGNEVYTNWATKEIVMDMDAVWCINQDVAADYNKINTDYVDNKVTLFDLFRIICGYFGMVCLPTGISTFKLVHKSALTDFDIDSVTPKAKYDKTMNEAKYNSMSNDYKYTRRDLYYTSPGATATLDIPSDKARVPKNYGTLNTAYNVHWFNNLWFMMRDRNVNGGCDKNTSQWGLAGWNDKSLNKDFTLGATKSEILETVETTIITDVYDVLSNKIKVGTNRSAIVKSDLL